MNRCAVPFPICSGTQLKIVESIAMGTPVISTAIGAQGLVLRHGQDILLADAGEMFVRETIRALCDGGLSKHLQHPAQQTVRARFSWRALGEQLIAAYNRAMAA